MDNLLLAWQEFVKGKKAKSDVINFSSRLFDNILQLHCDFANKTYRHGGYRSFYIADPKLRHIHKANVRDRLVHHAIYRQLYPLFAKTFIADSFSCQLGKGTHRAVRRFNTFAYRASKNNTATCWVLKCDIRKFFENIDHGVLLAMISDHIADRGIIDLLSEIIRSFEARTGKGLPLGNLTSQLFVNIYMNKFDQFAKHKLKARHYLRYADDFVIMSDNRESLNKDLRLADEFLRKELKLELHPQKVFIKTIASGVDFLGWVNFSNYAVLRTKTKRRMFSCLRENATPQALASYLGLFKHGNAYGLRQELLNNYWFWKG